MTDEARLWAELGERLARLAETTDGPVRFWLRDDDATRPSPVLDHLLAIAGDADMPIALAVIPAEAQDALAETLAPLAGVSVLQHGWSHRNHAPETAKKAELGDHRPAEAVLAELATGAGRLAGFPHVRPVLVPPWNRIGENVAAGLPALGFAGLSLFADKPIPGQGARLPRLDTHLDPVAWRRDRAFLGVEAAIGVLVRRLDRMLAGEVDPGAATGILTHHLVQDAQTFTFLRALLGYLAKREDCRFISVDELLPSLEAA